MNTATKIEVIQFLLGNYSPHGETNMDDKSLLNLDCVEELLNELVDKLIDNAHERYHYAASIKTIGEKSYEILNNLLVELGTRKI